jgi:hypothetical protein
MPLVIEKIIPGEITSKEVSSMIFLTNREKKKEKNKQ